MIVAIDTSSFVAFLQGESGTDVEKIDSALEVGSVLMPPVVLTELLSDPKLPKKVSENLSAMPLMDITPGYWKRSATLRSEILAKGLKSRVADALIAQSCIDHQVGLITRDNDFRHYEEYGGLVLL